MLVEVYLVSSLRYSTLGGSNRIWSRDRSSVGSKGQLVLGSCLRVGGSRVLDISIFLAKKVDKGIVLS